MVEDLKADVVRQKRGAALLDGGAAIPQIHAGWFQGAVVFVTLLTEPDVR